MYDIAVFICLITNYHQNCIIRPIFYIDTVENIQQYIDDLITLNLNDPEKILFVGIL